MSVASKLSASGSKSWVRLAAIGAAALLLQAEAASAASISVTATLRDFSDSHPDFEAFLGSESGIVTPTLGVDGKPVYNVAAKGLTGAGSPTTTGKANFDQWYNDVAGVNHKFTTTLTATETFAGSGIYEYINGSYFPLDGTGAAAKGFGHEGRSHNYHFTSEIHTAFTYTGGETFDFLGDDDVWVFINGVLAIDLGGVHGPESDSVSLDAEAATLGISIGGTYDLDIFHAERRTSGSNFNFTTSIVLVDAPEVPEPGALAIMGLGLAGLAFARRRKTA